MGRDLTCWIENTSYYLVLWILMQYDYCCDCYLSYVMMMVQLLMSVTLMVQWVFLLEAQVVYWH